MTSIHSRATTSGRRRFQALVSMLTAAALVAACGTRVDLEDIVAAEGGGEIVLSEDTAPQDAPSTASDFPAEEDSTPVMPGDTVPATGAEPSAGASRDSAPGTSTAGEAEDAAAAGCAEPGPPIRIGQVGSWSGLIGQTVGPGRPALEMWAQYMNARGGVACHPVEVISVDDRSDPARSQAAVQDLVRNDGVVAIVGSMVPISIAGFEEGIDNVGVPAIGGDGATPNWNQHPLLYYVGADINASLFIPIKAAVTDGYRRLGLLYCVEASACAHVNSMISGPVKDEAGAELVYKATISLAQTDYTAQCQAAKDAGVEQLFLGMEGASIQRLARSCNGIGYHPRLVTITMAAGFDPSDPNIQRFDLVFGSAVFPFMLRSGTPGIDRWSEALSQFGLEPHSAAAQVWASGEMFRRSIELLGPDARSQEITPELVIQGLSMVRDETLDGLIQPINYFEGQDGTEVVGCGYLSVYSDGEWTAPQTLEPVCRP